MPLIYLILLLCSLVCGQGKNVDLQHVIRGVANEHRGPLDNLSQGHVVRSYDHPGYRSDKIRILPSHVNSAPGKLLVDHLSHDGGLYHYGPSGASPYSHAHDLATLKGLFDKSGSLDAVNDNSAGIGSRDGVSIARSPIYEHYIISETDSDDATSGIGRIHPYLYQKPHLNRVINQRPHLLGPKYNLVNSLFRSDDSSHDTGDTEAISRVADRNENRSDGDVKTALGLNALLSAGLGNQSTAHHGLLGLHVN